MQITTGPLVVAGMPLQRVRNGFLAKRMRPAERNLALSGGVASAIDDLHPIRGAGSCLPVVAIARPSGLVPAGLEQAPDRLRQQAVIPSRCQAGSGSGAVLWKRIVVAFVTSHAGRSSGQTSQASNCLQALGESIKPLLAVDLPAFGLKNSVHQPVGDLLGRIFADVNHGCVGHDGALLKGRSAHRAARGWRGRCRPSACPQRTIAGPVR